MVALLDTDILIDYLRDFEPAVEFVESVASSACLSVMSVAELYQGVREGGERYKLSQTLSVFTILPISSDIAERAGLFSRDYRKSHGCGLADCLIAATAELHGLTLQSLNAKHYPMLSDCQIPYQKF